MVAVCCSHGTAQHTPGKGGRASQGRQSLKPSGSGLSKYARSALFSRYAGALKDGMHDDTSYAAEHAFRVRFSISSVNEIREVQRKSKGMYSRLLLVR
jgi:hypothetical protein